MCIRDRINPAPNQLILRIQPNEGATFKFEVKSPGSGMKSRPVEMEFSYDESFGEPSDEGYVRLLADAMLSDLRQKFSLITGVGREFLFI